jgi:hypothetical protein
VTLRQFVTFFGGFGLLLGGIGAVQVLIATGGNAGATLIMLLFGVTLGVLAGAFRVVQLRYSPAARARWEAQVRASAGRSRFDLATATLLLLSVLPLLASALDPPAWVPLALLIPTLMVLAARHWWGRTS